MAVRIGELLLKEKRISPEQLQEALNYQRQQGGKLGYNLIKLGFVKDDEITALLSKQYGVPSISLQKFEIDPAVIKLVPAETAQRYQIIPLSRAGATLTIAMTDPTNVFAMEWSRPKSRSPTPSRSTTVRPSRRTSPPVPSKWRRARWKKCRC
jgi:type IV pilus assembly protein PilB